MRQPKQIIKRIVDFAMIVLLPFLMAEILIGQAIHEWLGASMFVLFVIHHILNFGWWKSFVKGKYTPSRALGVALDLLLFLDMAALVYSGIMMSDVVFAFLGINGGMTLARQLHLFASYWGLILMSAHLGLHMEQFFGIGKKLFHIAKGSTAGTWALRAVAAALSLYGIYAFFTQHMVDYLFFQTHFVMFDETKAAAVYFAETVAMIGLFAVIAHDINKLLRKAYRTSEKKKSDGKGWKALSFIIPAIACIFVLIGLNLPSETKTWQNSPEEPSVSGISDVTESTQPMESGQPSDQVVTVQDGLIFVKGGSFTMGSPEDEPWRSADEIPHTVTVSDFYMSPYEVRQSDYMAVMGNNPSNFSGDDLPVENVPWLEAIAYCNALSEKESLMPVYTTRGHTVTWDRSANGYRLPTEAEWEYACRAGTTTPFNTETSISPEESNYYGHYPYEIENNYFSQGNLTTKPGEYRQTTVDVDSFSSNRFGLYNMHGNVGEWVWDYYGSYSTEEQADPVGAKSGTLRVYRGGGWNDFAKNMRSAYRATMAEDKGSFNIGIRLVRNAAVGTGSIVSTDMQNGDSTGGKVLIAFFSWGGNTKGIAEEIQSQTGADLFEITLVEPYSIDYNTVLDEAQRDQNEQARPELAVHVENMEDYDTVILGYQLVGIYPHADRFFS